jgi:tRNA(Leu) C34 or U34 (ribose-2'-O)-methylase TrmL
MNRGFFGIGIYNPINKVNIGTLWRGAFLFGADFIFTIGKQYKRQSSDTYNAPKHVPLWHFETFEEFQKAMPIDAPLICIEQCDKAINLKDFVHPERAIYLLGAEDNGLPKRIIEKYPVIFIETEISRSMNVAIAGNIIMYDRRIKRGE